VLTLAAGSWRASRLEERVKRGRRYMQRGAWYAAVGEFEWATRLDSGRDPETQAEYGRALVAAGRRRVAIAAFRRAVALELERGAEKSAGELYLELQRLLPAAVLDPPEQLRVARILRREGEFEAAAHALADFAGACAGHPQAELARFLSAEIRAELLGDVEGAATLFREVDVRQLTPRWRQHLMARRQGSGRREGRRCLDGAA
jgi:tetratricopeptide (TPR) repeat protein